MGIVSLRMCIVGCDDLLCNMWEFLVRLDISVCFASILMAMSFGWMSILSFLSIELFMGFFCGYIKDGLVQTLVQR